jgi:hypothetical protein
VNKYISLTVVLSTALGVGACSKPANTNVVVQTGNSMNTNTANTADSTTAASPAPAAVVAGSPSEVYKTAHYARQKKDIETLKKIFSKDILEFFTEIGKEDKKSLDDMLREMCEDPIPGEPEIRNEKITGDKATLEYKEDGEWKTVDFVKEDGSWKMTIPKGEAGPDGGKDKDKDKETKDKK